MLKHCLQMIQLVWFLVLRTVTLRSLWALSVLSCWAEEVGVGCSGWGFGSLQTCASPSAVASLKLVPVFVPAFDLSCAESSVV